IAYNLLTSITLLTHGATALATLCVAGITANLDRCRSHLDRSTARITAMVPEIGYARAAERAKAMLGNE
ncbi:MAG: aspartate ammonia-lyase, partial [Rhodobacteraceae bacterium]|nr:aspartate ammonia-lyase [Paracoccaceae bacterium]